MNLDQIIRKNLIKGICLVMLLGCISHFIIFRYFTYKYNDKILYEYKKGIENYVKLHDTLQVYSSTMLKPSRIEEQIIKDPSHHPESVKDILLYNEVTQDYRSFRQLCFTIYYKNHWHLIKVNQPYIESKDLLILIILSLFLIMLLLLLFIYLVLYYLRKDIGIPFYKNLRLLRNYNVKAHSELSLVDYNVHELNDFNKVIQKMLRKINADYENSRIFIEDASHEMQTPLSIIKSRLELILQSNLIQDEWQTKNIQIILRATTRLSKLNRSLSLLTKINNDQFHNKESIDFKYLIINYLSEMEELMASKDITTEVQLETFTFEIDPILADQLISNLLNNAIFHNLSNGGKIKITLEECGFLLIENTCLPIATSENLFNRLIHGKKENSTGLGLNIVKSICDKNNILIEYKHIDSSIFQIFINFYKS